MDDFRGFYQAWNFRLVEGAIEGAVDGAIEGARASVRKKLAILLSHIVKVEGKRTPDYADLTGINQKSTCS